METEIVTYRHDLGQGLYLDAFAVDPALSESDLKEKVCSYQRACPFDLKALEKDIRAIEHPEGKRLWTLDELNIEAEGRQYEIPEPLRAYREALAICEDIEGRFNGSISVIDGRPGKNIRLIRGGFYDYSATQLRAVPGDLLGNLMSIPIENLIGEKRFRHARGEEDRFYLIYDERLIDRFRAGTLDEFLRKRGCNEETIKRFSRQTIGESLGDSEFSRAFDVETKQIKALIGAYPRGHTVEDLMPGYEMKNEDRARYLVFAHLIFPEDGARLQLDQRGKNLGVAADCISSMGSTPKFSEDFLKPGFNFHQYYEEHIAEEMDEEFGLKTSEFSIRGLYLLDDRSTMPHAAFQIVTPLSTRELAGRVLEMEKRKGEEAIGEHPFLYSIPIEAIGRFLQTFEIWPNVAYATYLVSRDKAA